MILLAVAVGALLLLKIFQDNSEPEGRRGGGVVAHSGLLPHSWCVLEPMKGQDINPGCLHFRGHAGGDGAGADCQSITAAGNRGNLPQDG